MNLLGPVDVNSGALTTLYCNLENYAHAALIVTMGVVTNDVLIKVYESKDNAGAVKEFKGFDYYEEKTDSGDTLTTRKTAGVGGFQTGTNDDTTFVIEIDASELTADYTYLAILTDNAAAALISVLAVLSGSRYKGDPASQSPSAL